MKRARLLSLFILPFIAAAALAEETKPTPKKAASAKAAANTTEGTFLGLEEGDYTHWRMKSGGEEVSFFVLQPDKSVEKVIEEPSKFKDRKCRVRWKETVENLPEAGGRTKIRQVVSVEWL